MEAPNCCLRCYPPSRRFRSVYFAPRSHAPSYPPSRRFRRSSENVPGSPLCYPPSRRFRSHGWGFFAPALDIVLVYMAREEEGMALARGGWAVLLAEGTLQEQLREREGRQAVAAGVKREKGYSMNNKQGLPYSIPYSILLPQKGERSCHYLCQRKRKSFAVHTVNVIRR